MSEPSRRKPIKIGVHRGGGPPPGYRWSVEILDVSTDEAMKFLNGEQYAHLSQQVRALAQQDDPTHSEAIDVRPIEDYYEIRDKGGILCRLNVRVFFCVEKSRRTIVVLGTINKKNDGPTREPDKIRMRLRLKRRIAGKL